MQESDEALIRKYILPLLLGPMKRPVLDSRHTTSSVYTRPPSAYDRHLHRSIILRNVRFEPDMLIDFQNLLLPRLLQRHDLIRYLRSKQAVPFMLKWIQTACKFAAFDSAIKEDSISSSFDLLMQPVLLSATLILFDVSVEQLDFTGLLHQANQDAEEDYQDANKDDQDAEEDDQNTEEDDQDTEEDDQDVEDDDQDAEEDDQGADDHSPSPPQFFACVASPEAETIADKTVRVIQNEQTLPLELLPYASMNPFLCIELKDLLAADPRVYLSLLLLIAIALRKPEVVFPWPKTTCQGCDAFAESHKAQSAPGTGGFPQDSSEARTPLIRTSLRTRTELRAAIKAIQDYIPKWDKRVGKFRRRETRVSHTTPNDGDKNELSKMKTAMEGVFQEFGIKEKYRGSAKGWLQHAIYLTIQGWSHRVRHDTTYELISSCQVSWVIHRHRASQSALISPFFVPNGKDTIPTILGIIIKAFEDAKIRFDENGQQSWGYPNRMHGGSVPHTEQDKSESEGEQDKPPPKKKRRTLNPTPTASASGGVQHSADLLNVERLHLAFRVSGRTLWSDGFTDLFRILKIQPEAYSATDSPPHPRPSLHKLDESLIMRSLSPPLSPGSSVSNRSTVPPLMPNPSEHRHSLPTTQSSSSEYHATTSFSDFPQLYPKTPRSELGTISSRAGLFLEHLIAQGAVGDVWGGYMIIEDYSILQRPIVAKMATNQRGKEELLREGEIYRYLAKQLHGSITSCCYGVFDDTDGTTALILDHLGTALESFDNLGFQAQCIYDKVKAFHKIGVCHNDLEPRNVLIDKFGHAHIVDFHLSETDHKCHLPTGCDELQSLAQRLGLTAVEGTVLQGEC